MSKERLYIFDTTLRDGAQTQGVDFSLEDKEKIALALDNLGVDYIEAGWPGANPTDTEFFQKKHNFKKNKASISESEIEKMLSLRDKARENKNYKEADRIREELLDKGVLIEDKDDKTLWKFK